MNSIDGQGFPGGGSEMAERIRHKDWSNTALGPIESWPPLLRVTAGLVLEIGLPCILHWGKELGAIYNDAYRALMGDKPEGLGCSPCEIWPEAAEILRPVINRVLAGETTYFKSSPFILRRYGHPEKAWFDWTYSPLRDEKGEVVGILNLAVETTDEVLQERRRSFLLHLSDLLRDQAGPLEMGAVLSRTLGEFLEVDRAAYLEWEEQEATWKIEGAWRSGRLPPAEEDFALGCFGEELMDLLRRGEPVRMDDLPAWWRRNQKKSPAIPPVHAAGAAIYAPIMAEHRLVAILFVQTASPRRWSGGDVGLLQEAAARTWSAIRRARAEQALVRSEERFRSLADAMPQLVWTADPDGAVDYYNSRVREFAGFHQDESGRWVWDAVVHPEDREATVAAWSAAVGSGETYQIEHRVQLVDGTYRWLLSRAVPATEGGRIVKWFGTATDIDDSKRGEAALRNTEAQRSALIAHAPIGMYLADSQLRLKEINARALPVFEGSGKLIGAPLAELMKALMPEAAAQDITRHFEETLRTGASYIAPTFTGRLGPGSEQRHIDWQIHRVTLPDGSYGVVCYFLDVTPHVLALQKLEESEERFRAMADGLPLIVWVHDAEGAQEFVNQTFCEFFGVTREQMKGGEWQLLMHPDDAEAYTAEFLRSLRERKPFHAEVRVRDARKRWRRIESWGRPRFSKAGEYLGMVGTSADITERTRAVEAMKKSEQDLRRLSETLEKRVSERTAELQQQTDRLRDLAAELASAEQRERKRLAALLHDELQQFLVAATMQMPVIGRQLTDDAGRRALERATRWLDEASQAARDLTRQLRPPTLYEGGLLPALHWLASEMKERHRLEIHIVEGTVRPSLTDDVKALVFECVRELLFNIAKYAGVERATVRVWEHQNFLRILVSDEGRGFDVQRISSRPSGGFGLFSIRERLAALGGDMTIESIPHKGTRVELAVPLEEEPVGREAAAVPRFQPPHKGVGGRGLLTTDPRVRVLVVDDHAMVREGIANILDADSRILVVGAVGDGIAALEAVRERSPDVVLMDLNMPRMNGIEATRQICSLCPGVCVVGLSVQSDDATAKSMLDAGAAAFLSKAGDTEPMIATILRLAEKARAAR